MTDDENTMDAITSAKEEAGELLSTALNELRKAAMAKDDEGKRLFFPNGIELISIGLTLKNITLEFKVAGAEGIKGLLNSEETENIEKQEGDSLRP